MPEGVIVPKKEFTHFVEREEGVTLHFKDGSEEHADVLVAADGVRFKVRYQLYPDCPQPREFGIAVWLGWCEAKDIDFEWKSTPPHLMRPMARAWQSKTVIF